MHVHSGAIITVDRLGHEGRGLTVTQCDIFDDVLILHHIVSHRHHLIETKVNFALPGSTHFVVLALHLQTAIDQCLHHVVTDIHQMIVGRHWKVATLVTDLMAQVGTLILATIPFSFDAVQVEKSTLGRLVESHIVKNEKLCFGTEKRRVGDAGALQISNRFSCDVSRVATVILAGDRILDIADEIHRRQLREGILPSRLRLGHDQHVALVDALPTANT